MKMSILVAISAASLMTTMVACEKKSKGHKDDPKPEQSNESVSPAKVATADAVCSGQANMLRMAEDSVKSSCKDIKTKQAVVDAEWSIFSPSVNFSDAQDVCKKAELDPSMKSMYCLSKDQNKLLTNASKLELAKMDKFAALEACELIEAKDSAVIGEYGTVDFDTVCSDIRAVYREHINELSKVSLQKEIMDHVTSLAESRN